MTKKEKLKLKQSIDEVLFAITGDHSSMQLLEHTTTLKAKIDAGLPFISELTNFLSEVGGCIGNIIFNK